MTKHTPGPWKIVDSESAPWGRIQVAPDRYITVEGRSLKEAKANVALIAAAPETKQQRDDLLDVCRRANNCLETHGKIDSGTTLHRNIAAAIAKAEE